MLLEVIIVETLSNFKNNNMKLFSRISTKTVRFTLNCLMKKLKWYNNVRINTTINNHTGNFHQILVFIIAFTRYEINKIGSFYTIDRYYKYSIFFQFILYWNMITDYIFRNVIQDSL